jgi:hypothetical protein
MAPVPVQSLTITSEDGVRLEAEGADPTGASRVTAVLCHPHPQHGGTMRSIVIGALFDALPASGVRCLRFNFRGVEGSTGVHDHGQGELLDVKAALDVADHSRGPTEPMLLAGWSFGADMALATSDRRVAGWLAIAPPLRSSDRFDIVARDRRPKHLVLGQHDEIRAPESIVSDIENWNATTVDVIPGASHFFVGRTDRVVDAAVSFVERLAASA